jgi:hypothetical protein
MNKVHLENIVFCQGDDYNTLCQDLDPDYDPLDVYAADFTENQLIEYLLQWWYPGEHSINIYNAEDINTEFLGYEVNIDNCDDIFLLSHNSTIGYAGLSRIVKMEII